MKQLTFNDSFIAFLHRKNKNWVICHNAAFNQMCLDISNKLNPNVDIGVDTMELLNLFISKLGKACFIHACALFSPLISDLKIKVRDKHISAHKFVLAARSDAWSLANLASTEELDLSGQLLLSDM